MFKLFNKQYWVGTHRQVSVALCGPAVSPLAIGMEEGWDMGKANGLSIQWIMQGTPEGFKKKQDLSSSTPVIEQQYNIFEYLSCTNFL